MPLIDVRCPKCKHSEEKLYLGTGPKEPATCPKCGSVMQRVIHPASLQFRGPGFHVNDYPRK